MAVAQGELTVFGEKRFFREPGDAQGFGGAVSLIRVLRIRPRAVLHGLHAGVQHVVERGVRAVPHGLGAFENVRKRLLARLLFLPAFADFEALGKLHHHPDVASGFTRRQYHLMPPLRAAFGVAVKAPFFKDHRDRQNQVGDLGREGRIGVCDHHKVFGFARGFEPVVRVRRGLEDIDDLRPHKVDRAVFKTAQKAHHGFAQNRVQGSCGQIPETFGLLFMRFVADEHIGREPVRERTHFTGRAAGRGLTGERKCAVTRAGLLVGEKMQGVDLFVYPHTAHVLVHTHAPEGEDVTLLVAEGVGQMHELFLEGFERLVGIALGEFGDEVQGIGFKTTLIFFKGDVPVAARGLLLLNDLTGLAALADGFFRGERNLELLCLRVFFGFKGKLRSGAHAVADINGTRSKDAVFRDEVLVIGLAAHDFAGNVIQNRKIGVGLKDDFGVGHVRRHVRRRRQIDDAGVLVRELAVRDAAPEDGVGFSHVVAPEHHRVALFNIGVDVAGFVNAEGLIKAHNGGSHTEARIRVNVVGAEPGLHEFTGAVRFRNRVLAGTDDGDAFRTLCLVGAAQLFLHFVESLFPAHRLKAPVLVEFAVLLTHQGLREAVLAVENLGVEVTLNAVKTAVHRGFGVTLGGHDAAVEGADL